MTTRGDLAMNLLNAAEELRRTAFGSPGYTGRLANVADALGELCRSEIPDQVQDTGDGSKFWELGDWRLLIEARKLMERRDGMPDPSA